MSRAEAILRRELKRTMTPRQQEVLTVLDSLIDGITVRMLGDWLDTTTANAHNLGNTMQARGYARMEILSRNSRAHITDDGRLVLRLLTSKGGTQ